jgi:hypothetical protein
MGNCWSHIWGRLPPLRVCYGDDLSRNANSESAAARLTIDFCIYPDEIDHDRWGRRVPRTCTYCGFLEPL